MWFPFAKPLLVVASLGAFFSTASAEKMLQSSSLNTCQADSGFTASLFNVVFTPGNNSANVDIVAVSSIEGDVVFDVKISAYGYQIIRSTVDPCDVGLAGLCPMTAGKLSLNFNLAVTADAVEQIPGIAYTFPDLDAKVRMYFNMTSGEHANTSVACVEAQISNGKTVDLVGIKWATAIVAGLALGSSAIVSGLGHSNAAMHVAANALSLFGYFQSQAMVGLTGVSLPPAAQSWTQDFQWSMGIIRVGFMQTIFTWYQRATGGTPSTLFSSLSSVSVEVEKRSLDAYSSIESAAGSYMPRSVAMMPRALARTAQTASHAVSSLAKRGNIESSSGSYVVYGIQRVAYRADIESTNLVMTGIAFFIVFVLFIIIGVAAFKGILEVAAKQKWIKGDTFLDFRNGWLTVLKGILFRICLIGFPPITILCMWEFTQIDSAAEVVLAVFFFFGELAVLGWAASKVIRIARRSMIMHRNPAYILFSDPQALNKWGFLYVQFRASAYYFIVPILFYTMVKGMFVAFAQARGTVQAIAFLLLDAFLLIAVSVLRPWMDKSTNSFNISICVMNFLNAIFLLIFTDVFNQPDIVTGVVGVVLWIANAIFSLILLLMLIISTTMVFFRKNPDTRYQFMADDRASFMKSQTQLTTTTELDALAATARGDKAGYKPGLDLDDDTESISSDSLRRRTDPSHMNAVAPSSSASGQNSYREPTRSPVDPSVPLFPADNKSSRSGASGTPSGYENGSYGNGTAYNNNYGRGQGPPMPRSASPYASSSVSGGYRSQNNASPSFRAQNNASPNGFRQQNNSSPWQRGAGYEH